MKKVDLKDLSRWLLVMPGTGIEFERPDARTVRIELFAQSLAGVSLVREDGEIQFLANVEELTLLEFVEAGRFEVIVDAPCYMYSAEFETVAFTVPDPVIFTKIAERRQRSPELEYMMKIMHANMEKLHGKLDVERARYESQLAEARRNTGTPPVVADPPVRGSDDGAGQSAGNPEPAEV